MTYPCDLSACQPWNPAGNLDNHCLQPHLKTNTGQSSSHELLQYTSSDVKDGECSSNLGLGQSTPLSLPLRSILQTFTACSPWPLTRHGAVSRKDTLKLQQL